MAKRRLPSRDQCIAGIPVVLANAEEHLEAADVLAGAGKHGFAVAHLVYALEEGEKARTLGKVVLGEAMTEDQIRRGLYEHRDRHVGAMAKSWSSGGAVVDFLTEGLRERVGRRPVRTETERWADVDARHPEVLPVAWPETAGSTRERSLYADLREAGWMSPVDTGAAEFERLRPAVASLLLQLRAAYQREILPLVGAIS
jgi:AbiV family abortive infection protein